MKLIPIEERKQHKCYYCGTNKSVKYVAKSNTGENIYYCNRCTLALLKSKSGIGGMVDAPELESDVFKT